MNFKEIILGQDPIDQKIKNISQLFERDEFILQILAPSDFLALYIPFSIDVLNTIEVEKVDSSSKNEMRAFILTSLNKFIFKDNRSEEFVRTLHKVLGEDNLTNVILTLKIFASLIKSPSMTSDLLEEHISVVVDLVTAIFLKLDNFEEGKAESAFSTLGQVFGYVSDVIQRQAATEKKIDGIVHRTVTFFRSFLEHRRVTEHTKYNKAFALEMISTLSKLFKIASDSPIFTSRNDALNSTIFELSKFALFYCPTDAIDLRKELFYYIFKILLKNKEMYLPKIEEFFDMRFFYLDESFLINIKGLIGLTDLASAYSEHLSRRVPYELQRRTGEILENNLVMVLEKVSTNSTVEEGSLLEDEMKLKYEKSLGFHLEIVYECVGLIYKHLAILEKFHFQKVEVIDFSLKQFFLVKQIVEFLERISSESNPHITQHLVLIKSVFLALSKPLKEMADGLLKGSSDTPFSTEVVFSTFNSVLKILEVFDFEDKDSHFISEILLFFFSPFNGTVILDITNSLISQMFRSPKDIKIYLEILKKCSNGHLQMVVSEVVYQLISMLTQETNFKKPVYSPKRLAYPEMVELYEPVFDFIADVYNYNPNFISKKTMYTLINFLNRVISSKDIEDHKLLLFLLGTFDIKSDKSGALHVFFYKKLHVSVRDFFDLYTSSLNPLYLDIIFSFPINLNAIASEWAFLLNPIRCALRLKDDTALKAISAFIHIIEASKGEINNKREVEELFKEIYELLEDQRFIISCSQLIGRLKSFHKNYLSSSFFFTTKKSPTNCFLLSQQGAGEKFAFDGVVSKAVDFMRGKTIVDLKRTIFNTREVTGFKKTLPDVRRDCGGEEAAFIVIKDFLYSALGWDKEHLLGSPVVCSKQFLDTSVDYTISKVHDSRPLSLEDQLSQSQLIYDAILGLLQCSEAIQDKVYHFLKDVYEFIAQGIHSSLLINGNVFLRALLEGFGEFNTKLPTKLLYDFLNSFGRIASPLEITREIISFFLSIGPSTTSRMSTNPKMSRALFNGLSAILSFENLPIQIVQEDLKTLLDGLILHVSRMKAFTRDMISGLDSLAKRSNDHKCICSIFKWAIDRISLGQLSSKVEIRFCKEIIKLLVSRHEKLYVSVFKTNLRSFFYTVDDMRDIDIFYTKVDLFVFFIKKTVLFTQEEMIVLVKTYYYYILSCNFFIFNASQGTFLTNLSIKSSEKYKKWEKCLLKRKDLISHLFYELPKDNLEFYDYTFEYHDYALDVSEVESYYFYLANEIIYMHLAFSKDKEMAFEAFDFIFHNLPFGLDIPLKMLIAVNRPLIHELLLDKYEECFNSTLSVQVVKKMITIFSVVEMKEDKKLLNFILKIFEECQTPVEGLLFAEDPESSILFKTFELSLMYPNQTHLHQNILRVAFPWLYKSSKCHTTSISGGLLDYIEKNSFLCFPLLVRECLDESAFFLVNFLHEKSISFKNFVNNLSQGFLEECFEGICGREPKDYNTQNVLFFLRFLQLIDHEVSNSQIKSAIRIYGDFKVQNKDTKIIKDFLKYSLNRFTESDLNALFKTDPLLKLAGSCNVKMFKSLSSKSLYGCLLKSINKADRKSFENLIRFYGEQSWMLIEMFVDVEFYSSRMVEYCKNNLGNINIRSYLLYYLCTFEPLVEYFDLLLKLSFEERKYTLYSLRKITEKYPGEEFERVILSYLKSEILYKTNIHIIYPLIAHTPSLMTKNIARVLCGVVYRLLNTYVQFHQKIGTQLFDALYSFYGPCDVLRNLYSLLILNYFHSKKNNMLQYIKKYDFELDLHAFRLYGVTHSDILELSHVISFIECVVMSPQSYEYKIEIVNYFYDIVKKDWFKYALKEETVIFLYRDLTPFPKEMHKTTFLNFLKITKEGGAVSWKQILPIIKGLVQDPELPASFIPIFHLFCDFSIYSPPTTHYFVDFVVYLIEKKITSLQKTIHDLLLDLKTPIPLKIALFSSLVPKFHVILKEEDLLNMALNFFLRHKLVQPGVLSPLNELFYRGCTHPNRVIRNKYIQFLNEILPSDPLSRFVSLLEVDWVGCDKKFIAYLMTVLLLGCYDSFEIQCDFKCVYMNRKEVEGDKKDYKAIQKVSSHQSQDHKNDLLDFLYVYPEASLPLLFELTKPFSFHSIDLKSLAPFVNDDLFYTLLQSIGCPKEFDFKKLNPGHLTFYHLLNEVKCPVSMYKELGIRDYVYGSLRANSKFPEVMQATVFQQLGKVKEAQRIYEELKGECCESKISFYEDEYETILREWIDCSKELQQWDICYTLGKHKGDVTLSADSLFFLSNFNIPSERDTFLNMVGLMERGVMRSFYELFYTIYQTPAPDDFVNLLILIIKKMSNGPRTKEFNSFYSNLIQIILEMHDTSSLFSFRPDTEERINSLSYAWEDREPLIEGPYEVLLMFSTWRRHFFRRVEGFSSEGNSLLGPDERSQGEMDTVTIGNIVNKNKEYSEAINKLRKTMYIKGNNELGRNANFLALAAFKKGYYDNALFLLKEVFELPSIKIIDAYRKVIYELLCFYELNENKLGLDLANSTNIVHFSDEQSSNIFRMRGMFSEKIKDLEESKRLYFQAIQFFSSTENFFYYTNLLYKNFDEHVDFIDEIISSALQGLALTESAHSKHLVMMFLTILEEHTLSYDMTLFKSLVKFVNLAHFVFFIPDLLKIEKNGEYLEVILEGLKKKYPEAMFMGEYSLRDGEEESVCQEENVCKEGNVNDNNSKEGNVNNNNSKEGNVNNNNSKEGNVNNLMNDNDNNSMSAKDENKKHVEICSEIDSNATDYSKSKFPSSLLSSLSTDSPPDIILPSCIKISPPIRKPKPYLDLLKAFEEVCRLEETVRVEIEMIDLLDEFINHIVDSITAINAEDYLKRLIDLADKCPDLDLDLGPCESLSDLLSHLVSIRRDLRSFMRSANTLEKNKKLDRLNKILSENTLALFGSYNRIQKDYSNVVHVEAFFSYDVYRREKHTKELYLIGSDGRYYKYELYHVDKPGIENLYSLHHILSLELSDCYHLRSREAFIHPVNTQKIRKSLHVDILDMNCVEFEEICDGWKENYLVKYVGEYIKASVMKVIKETNENKERINDKEEHIILFKDLEKNILELLKPEKTNKKHKKSQISLSDFFRSLKTNWSLPKISSKTRLKVYSKVLPVTSEVLPSYFKANADSSFAYFMQRYSFSKSYALSLSINNFLKTKTKSPRLDVIQMYTGLFMRKRLVISTLKDDSNHIYISPGIQEWLGVENIEGPFLSCLYLSSDFLVKSESFPLLMRYFSFDLVYAIKQLERVVKAEGNDHEVLKIISEWTDINLICKNEVSENIWV